MSTQHPKVDEKFLQKQRASLVALREQLKSTRDGQSEEQRMANETTQGEAREFEDDAQKLAILEIAGSVSVVNDSRLRDVERALQKIADGTYGLSDKSGSAIPVERLAAVPEALYTVAEQAENDANG